MVSPIKFFKDSVKRDRIFWRETKLKRIWLSFIGLWALLVASSYLWVEYSENLSLLALFFFFMGFSFCTADMMWVQKTKKEEFIKIRKGE